MKESETDREFTDLIKDTLDKFEEPYILGSWESFVRKKNRRKRFIILFTGTGIAASFLAGWLVLRIFIPGFNDVQIDGKQNLNLSESSAAAETPEDNSISQPASPVAQTTEHHPVQNKNILSSEIKSTPGKELLAVKNLSEKFETVTPVPDSNKFLAEKNREMLLGDSTKPGSLISGNVTDTENENKPLTEQENADNLQLNNPDAITVAENTIPDEQKQRRLRLGVNVSPGITSTSTAAAVNFGGGINADYELSRIFSLSTGIQVEQSNVKNENTESPSWVPPGETTARLIDIDLPLNLIWKFRIRKSTRYYIATGISSVAYLSEKYTTTSYTQKVVPVFGSQDGMQNVSYEVENVETKQENTEAPLNTFDFAGRINLLFGMEYNLSSGLFLHVEPYVKIPVSDLATQNLRFTTSGISCKVSF